MQNSESSGFSTFQQLFRQADEACGLEDSHVPRQRDTSHIDVLHSQHHTGRVRVAEPQLPLLRALVHTVPAEKSSGGIAGKCVVDWRTGRNSSKPFRSPAEEKQQLLRMQLNCISWEDEVRRVMKGEEHFEHNKEMEIVDDADNIKPLLSLNYDVSSYRFFEPDFVDLDNPEDPLEAVIPNGPGVEATDAGSGATGLSMEVEAVPGQSEHRAIINRLREMRNSRTTSSQEVSSYAKRPRDNISQQRVGYKVRSNVAAINHSKIALTHTNTKPDLSEAELRCFHRPRLKSTFLQRPWIISLPAATPASKEASISASRRKFTDAYKQDLSLANNNNDFIVLEYAEEFPPIMLNNGMASTMINYFRQPDDVDDANDERRQRARLAADKRLERLLGAAVGADGASSAGSMQFRLPRHVSLLLRKRFVKQTYEHDVNIPRLALGETKVISADDESPFLGKLDENEIQQSIANNLFCAPIYAHKPNKTDFLMVRTNTSANQLEYSLRIIPHIFLCGQLEPQKIVPRPSKKLTKLQEKFYRLAAIRSLKVRDSQTFEDLQKKILNYCNSSRVRHKQEHKTEFKNILKKIAERKQTIDGPRWFLKDDIYYNNSNTEAEGHTEEEIAGSFTPEDVCLQESCNAAEYRLVQDHIHDIELAKLETWISRIHRSKLMMQMRVDKLRDIIFNTQSLAQSSSSSKTNGTADNRTEKLGILRDIFVKAINRMDKKLAAARFIFDRLVTAPWNTTKTFVESLLNSDGKGRMELVGVGDPSGRGEGFAYVCHHQDSMTKKSQESLVKTDKDLRRLNRSDLIRLLEALGVSQAEIKNLKRWEQVRKIELLSTRLKKKGMAKELHKYARVEKLQPQLLEEEFNQKAQEIWIRQKLALTSSVPPSTIANAPTDRDEEEEDGSSSDEEMVKAFAERSNALQEKQRQEQALKAAELKKREEEKTDYESFCASLATKKKTPAISFSVGSDGRPVSTPRMQYEATAARAPSSDNNNLSNLTRAAPVGQRPRPSKVLKRVTHRLYSDGSESIHVEFILDKMLIEQATRDKERYLRLLQSKNLELDDTEDKPSIAEDSEEELEDSVEKKERLAVKIGRLKEAVQKNDAAELVAMGVGRAPTTSSSRAKVKLRERVPRVAFAAILEDKLLQIFKHQYAALFMNLVDPVGFPDYYQKVQKPICLTDIRNKIAAYEYETKADLLSDMDLLVTNAETYSKSDSDLVKKARKLVASMRIELDHDLKHLGKSKDRISLLEEVIRKKKSILSRSSGLQNSSYSTNKSKTPTSSKLMKISSTKTVSLTMSNDSSVKQVVPQNLSSSSSSSTAFSLPVVRSVPTPSDSAQHLKDGDSSSGEEEVISSGAIL